MTFPARTAYCNTASPKSGVIKATNSRLRLGSSIKGVTEFDDKPGIPASFVSHDSIAVANLVMVFDKGVPHASFRLDGSGAPRQSIEFKAMVFF